MIRFLNLQVLASNAIFLGVVIFLPFSLGRVVLYYLSWILSASNPVLSTVLPLTESALSLVDATTKGAVTAVANLSSGGYGESMVGQAVEAVAESMRKNITGVDEASNSVSKSVAADLLMGTSGTSRLSDVTTLAIGYMFIFCLVFLYLGLIALIRYARGESFTFGRLYGISSITEAIPSLARQFLAGMKHLVTTVKVAFLLVIELGVFPLMCGWWLDVHDIILFL